MSTFTQSYFYLNEKKQFNIIGGEFGRLRKAAAVTNPELLSQTSYECLFTID